MEKYDDENGPLRGSFEGSSERHSSEGLLSPTSQKRRVQFEVSIHLKMLHILLFGINIIGFIFLALSMRFRDVRPLVYCEFVTCTSSLPRHLTGKF